ncbi:MAG TPA: signal recognition particle protein [Gaiellaceae bacterium]|nr:signal recognition particle protein [Gaiellaceae bacterium]
MFDTLSNRLQGALGDLRKRGRLDEEAISRAMREVRLALLEADVNFEVVKTFVAQVRERALGAEVTKSVTPGQQVVKIVHEELTALMGSGDSRLAFVGRPPTVILLAGLQGSGKTTAAAKLALQLRKEGHRPGLVAADLQRPAAVDQLVQLGRQIDVPVFTGADDPVAVSREGVEQAKAEGLDVVVLDTAGRLHVDEALMDELAAVRDETRPTNVLLVLDSMTGQDAVRVAEAFADRIAFDGIVLTKLDGDARGGAALSVKAVTGKPVKLVSVGERLDQLEYFHPDRMASRILGMGDVLTLVEKAEAAVEADERDELEKRLMQGEFTFDDFLRSYKMLRRMGPVQGVLKLIPGLGSQMEGLDQVDDRQLARVEAIVLSMTPQERRYPHVIDGSRRQRIAKGSGSAVEQVNQLLEARKQMAKMMKQLGKGKMPALPGQPGQNGPTRSATKKKKAKRKKRTRR